MMWLLSSCQTWSAQAELANLTHWSRDPYAPPFAKGDIQNTGLERCLGFEWARSRRQGKSDTRQASEPVLIVHIRSRKCPVAPVASAPWENVQWLFRNPQIVAVDPQAVDRAVSFGAGKRLGAERGVGQALALQYVCEVNGTKLLAPA